MLNRAAGELKQTGERSLGFQKSGSSLPAAQERHTMHTNPFLPFTAISYPCRPRIMTSASREMDSGAALRAKAISAVRSIRYWSSEAIVGYGVLVSCAWARKAALTTTTSSKLVNALVASGGGDLDYAAIATVIFKLADLK